MARLRGELNTSLVEVGNYERALEQIMQAMQDGRLVLLDIVRTGLQSTGRKVSRGTVTALRDEGEAWLRGAVGH